jgi:hypothetical protein
MRGRSDTVRVVVGHIARWLRDEEARPEMRAANRVKTYVTLW